MVDPGASSLLFRKRSRVLEREVDCEGSAFDELRVVPIERPLHHLKSDEYPLEREEETSPGRQALLLRTRRNDGSLKKGRRENLRGKSRCSERTATVRVPEYCGKG